MLSIKKDNNSIFYQPLIFLASKKGNVELFKIFLNNSKDINVINSDNISILHYLIVLHHKCNSDVSSYLEMFEQALKHPEIEVNKQDNMQNTPIHLAIFLEQPKILELLLEHPRLNLKITDYYSNYPLDLIENIINNKQCGDDNKVIKIKDLLMNHNAEHSPIYKFLQHFNEVKVENELKGQETDPFAVFSNYNNGQVVVHYFSAPEDDVQTSGEQTPDKAEQ